MQRVGGNMIAVMDVAPEHTSRYGVLSPGREDGRLIEVKGLVEKPKPADAPSTAGGHRSLHPGAAAVRACSIASDARAPAARSS